MKRTLLQIVQNVLSDMDSEDVNSIGDSVEAQQIASVVQDTFYNMVTTRVIPEHQQLLKLTSLSSSARPTHFQVPTDVKRIDSISYNVNTTGDYEFKEIKYVGPLEFLSMVTEGTNVTDVEGGTNFKVHNDRMPSFYTSFDDYHIVMDAFDSSVGNTLTSNNTRAFGSKIPTFSLTDDYTPDIDDVMFPYLIAEAKSTCFSLFKSGVDQKIEQAARRQKSYMQNDMHRVGSDSKRPQYGRR